MKLAGTNKASKHSGLDLFIAMNSIFWSDKLFWYKVAQFRMILRALILSKDGI
jgi:hypothetical protein